MFSVLVSGCDWILFINGWFCPICLIYLIRWKSVYYRPQRSCEGYVFYRCLSVHRGSTWPGTPPGGRHPPEQTPQTKYIPLGQVHPPDQVHPLGPGTPPGTRYTPLGPGTPHWPGTPPWARYTPWDQVHPPGPGTPPGTRYTPPPEIRPLLWTVRILLECILVLKKDWLLYLELNRFFTHYFSIPILSF